MPASTPVPSWTPLPSVLDEASAPPSGRAAVGCSSASSEALVALSASGGACSKERSSAPGARSSSP
eukprot:143230-Prymnesium_polylepis.1